MLKLQWRTPVRLLNFLGSSSFNSTIFRGLGVNLSKVRSLDMDSWDLETLLVMAELGNTVVNKIYESRPTRDLSKPNPATDP